MTTKELILKAQGFLMMEAELRNELRRALSAILMDTDEEHPMKVDITLDEDRFCGLSSLELPHISRMWQDPSEGWIYFDMDGYGDAIDFDFLWTTELIQIFEELSSEHLVVLE